MRTIFSLTMTAILAGPAMAGETRELSAHEHGVGAFNIAVEGSTIAMELRAPGADIIGFEHAATTAEDKAKVEAGLAALAKPLELFVMPAAAECVAEDVDVDLVSEEGDHDDHGHGEEHAGHDDHGHGDEHAEHDDHGHDDHDHGEEHAEHDDRSHGDEHAEESHTEFHATYTLTCGDTAAVNAINFVYFEQFPNARELEVQMISENGTQGFEVTRDAPQLDLGGLI